MVVNLMPSMITRPELKVQGVISEGRFNASQIRWVLFWGFERCRRSI